jgi:hypothetical protein
MNQIFIIVALIICIVIIKLFFSDGEHFGSGALVQLYAKGPEDLYLTPDVYRYWDYANYLYDPSLFFWNTSTRYPRNYPYYLHEDYYHRSYPYISPPYYQTRYHSHSRKTSGCRHCK